MRDYDLFRGPTPPIAPYQSWMGAPKGSGLGAYILGPPIFIGRMPARRDIEIEPLGWLGRIRRRLAFLPLRLDMWRHPERYRPVILTGTVVDVPGTNGLLKMRELL